MKEATYKRYHIVQFNSHETYRKCKFMKAESRLVVTGYLGIGKLGKNE